MLSSECINIEKKLNPNRFSLININILENTYYLEIYRNDDSCLSNPAALPSSSSSSSNEPTSFLSSTTNQSNQVNHELFSISGETILSTPNSSYSEKSDDQKTHLNYSTSSKNSSPVTPILFLPKLFDLNKKLNQIPESILSSTSCSCCRQNINSFPKKNTPIFEPTISSTPVKQPKTSTPNSRIKYRQDYNYHKLHSSTRLEKNSISINFSLLSYQVVQIKQHSITKLNNLQVDLAYLEANNTANKKSVVFIQTEKKKISSVKDSVIKRCIMPFKKLYNKKSRSTK